MVTYDKSLIYWGIHSLQEGNVNTVNANDSAMISRTTSNGISKYRGIRPVVSLNSNIAILQQEGSLDNPHQIQ